MSEYTPGPWKADTFLVVAENGRSVTHTGLLGVRRSSHAGQHGNTEDEANARLIAAAPDLLQACESAVESLKAAVESNVDVPGFDAEEHVVVKRLRAAIAKATGEET